MKLVLAEKPSVAQSIAKVLGATKREDGYLEGNGYVVSWCVGHLVELSQPEAYDLSLIHISLRFSPRIVVSVSFQQVNDAPDSETCAKGDDQSLQNIDCAIEEIHILCAGIVSLWFLRWKPQSRNELAAVCGCRFRLLLSNFRLCFPPTLRFACVCCIVGVLLYGMGV